MAKRRLITYSISCRGATVDVSWTASRPSELAAPTILSRPLWFPPMTRLAPLCILLGLVTPAVAENWPQFRGPLATARPQHEQPLPAEIGPEANVVWKIELPPGHSSPIVWNDRIFVTGVRDDKQLVTIALDRVTGQTLWEVEAPHEKLEEIHEIGSHAQATPATDGERVYSFFGSCGLFCYDFNGKLLWQRAMGPFNNGFGAGSSPILDDDRVILCQDHDTDSFLLALDKVTGKELWKTDRSEFPRNYCTPVVWTIEGKKQIVVAATLRVVGYDLQTGRELWTVRGIARTVCASPTIGPDNTLYVASWAAGGDAGERIALDPFDIILKEVDKNADAQIQEDELPTGPVKQRYPQIDRDKTGGNTRDEYEFFRGLFAQGKNNVIAIKPGGMGDVTESHVAWTQTRLVPFCASPVYYDGTLFMIKDGGIMSSLNAVTGKPLKQSRLPATNEYYASPVAADGKIYCLNDEGKLTVTSAEASWQTLHSADFGEPVHATPAIVGANMYLRTASKLYCFGKAK